MTRFIILKEEMDDIMKTVESLEESGLLLKVLVKQLKTNQMNKNVDFLVCY